MHSVLKTGKCIVEAGIDFTRHPSFFPTLIIEEADDISVSVLEPVPETEEIFEVVMQWKEYELRQRATVPCHCLAFMAADDRVALGAFPPSEGEWHSGHIDRQQRTVRWKYDSKRG
ncbi:MAG: hypothetical protein DME25_10135 [Verrucomicrobia bacterium]|nr:MAG: hypothetical protein DME25_10135 [Verrucomicrobiota bacterium]